MSFLEDAIDRQVDGIVFNPMRSEDVRLETASLVSPALTTVLNPAHEIGQTCGRLLVERMAGDFAGETREVIIPNPLVVRSSTSHVSDRGSLRRHGAGVVTDRRVNEVGDNL